MPGHTLQHQVAPCRNDHSATENIQFGADGCKTNTGQLGNYKFDRTPNMKEISGLEPHCCTLMDWFTQYYDMENSMIVVFDIN